MTGSVFIITHCDLLCEVKLRCQRKPSQLDLSRLIGEEMERLLNQICEGIYMDKTEIIKVSQKFKKRKIHILPVNHLDIRK